MAEDPFEDVLNLEEQFYQDGYMEGQADGVRAGRIEGRQLGLEKGFLKFFESGRLYGRSIVWANRLPRSKEDATAKEVVVSGTTTEAEASAAYSVGLPTESLTPKNEEKQQLPVLTKNPRLQKHIVTLHALVETESLSTENTDEAVNDFDDRLKRAQGKAKIIERMVGEAATKSKAADAAGSSKPKTSEVEDV
ncbi:hypothetical protein B0H63DRAFT_223397 [Podospora didyma]|uniref:Essential protein Yae1 N-terminal domain-containing protein n=1 Tax=Podospora didyma TaxID=330526 RepID=A0AAE0NBZ1_9PEZI|nr:hypothetical protein B0H63DRAFT_223397 [Podospora didyma]